MVGWYPATALPEAGWTDRPDCLSSGCGASHGGCLRRKECEQT